MKKSLIPLCLGAFLMLAASCGNNQGSGNDSDSAATGATTATTVDTNRNNNASADTNRMTANTNEAPDGDFILEAASGGLMEVELGKTASNNAASSKVKQFGRMMVTDHTKANTELKAIAAKKNITLPATPQEKHQGHINELKAKKVRSLIKHMST